MHIHHYEFSAHGYESRAIANNGHLVVVAEQRYTATGEEEIVLSDWIYHIAKAIEAIHRP